MGPFVVVRIIILHCKGDRVLVWIALKDILHTVWNASKIYLGATKTNWTIEKTNLVTRRVILMLKSGPFVIILHHISHQCRNLEFCQVLWQYIFATVWKWSWCDDTQILLKLAFIRFFVFDVAERAVTIDYKIDPILLLSTCFEFI